MDNIADYTVRDLLEYRGRKHDLISVSQHASVKTAKTMMASPKLPGASSISRILAIESTKDPTMVGILTDSDIKEKVTALDRPENKVHVSSVMTREVVTADIDEPLSVVNKKMSEKNCGSLPVTEDGEVITLISAKDIQQFRNHRDEIAAKVASYQRHHQ